MPSDMALQPGNVQRYNNEVQIAGSDAAIGHKPGIYEEEPINPVHKGPQAAERSLETNGDGMSAAPAADPACVPEERQSDGHATAQEEEKTALVAVGIAVGLVVLCLSSR